jgi:hypothetical protein
MSIAHMNVRPYWNGSLAQAKPLGQHGRHGHAFGDRRLPMPIPNDALERFRPGPYDEIAGDIARGT